MSAKVRNCRLPNNTTYQDFVRNTLIIIDSSVGGMQPSNVILISEKEYQSCPIKKQNVLLSSGVKTFDAPFLVFPKKVVVSKTQQSKSTMRRTKAQQVVGDSRAMSPHIGIPRDRSDVPRVRQGCSSVDRQSRVHHVKAISASNKFFSCEG